MENFQSKNDNSKRYWFKRIGWTRRGLQYMPITWEGWLLLVVAVVSNLLNSYRLEPLLDITPGLFLPAFLPPAILTGVILVIIVWKKGDHS